MGPGERSLRGQPVDFGVRPASQVSPMEGDREPQELLPFRCAGISLSYAGPREIEDHPGEPRDDGRLLGRRHLPPRLDLTLLDCSRGVGAQGMEGHVSVYGWLPS